MAEVNIATEEAFERYYSGGFRTGNPYWMYLGFFSLLSIGMLVGMIFDWRLGGDALRAVPGVFVPNQTQYLFVAGLEIEMKLIEYAALSVASLVLAVCFMMVKK